MEHHPCCCDLMPGKDWTGVQENNAKNKLMATFIGHVSAVYKSFLQVLISRTQNSGVMPS